MQDQVTKCTVKTQEGVAAKLVQNWPGRSYSFFAIQVAGKEINIDEAIAILELLLQFQAAGAGVIAEAVTTAETLLPPDTDTKRPAPATPINRLASFRRLLQLGDPIVLQQALDACLTPASKQSVMDAYWAGMEARAIRYVHADREIHDIKASRQQKEVA
jgi:hypothetical protein